MKSRISHPLVVAAVLLSCGDPTRVRARFEVVSDTVVVSALTGSPLTARTALNTVRHEAVRAEGGSNYDVVFDIDPSGQALIYPAQAVASFGRAGLLKTTTPIDSIVTAPQDGYSEELTPTPINPDDVVLIRAVQASCRDEINPYIYSKLLITAVDVAQRTITFQIRVDPNCGFRSFRDGIPVN